MEMLSNKWVATVASIWIQCSVGAYTFGIYSSALKSSQGYDQSTLDTVSVFKDIGTNVGVLSGLLYSAVAVKICPSPWSATQLGGPWVVHLAGALQCFVGYFFMWAAVAGVIPRPPVTAMCFFMFLGSHSQTFFNTTNVVCGVQNFSNYSGTIVGIMKGFLALSGAISVLVYDIFCGGNPTNFLLMLALLPTFISLLLMFLVRTYKTTSTVDDKKHLNAFSAIALIIVAYRMIIIILQNFFTFPSWAQTFSFLLLLLLLVSPIGIAIRARRDDSKRVVVFESSDAGDVSKYEQLVPSSDDKLVLQNGEDLNLLQAVKTLNFWLLSVITVCGMGSGVATINNMSQVGESLGYKTIEINSFVSLWSIWNFLGRLGAGFLSDLLLHNKGWPRPLLMAITLAIMVSGHIIIASGFSGNLYIGSFLVGICYGSQWALMPTITSEIYGIGHMTTIFNTIAVASPIGSYIFSVRVIGNIYDREASKEAEGGSCLGTQCFMLSFMIMAFVAFFGFLIAILLFFRTKRFYQLVVLRRLKKSPLRQ
ncbi:protein NUCLEAR FUSION DEFECTIVE 4 [Ziziphus jujuba]|uniref:Protein NUCLEAR FUSION DEFECTIVE 4 n=1 Tax=Ziziphus jujuba TaxID=326968 RepID=A0A6P3ZS93_ZIZJJ|nr:protein NUCLEAR FUSION DEFECTIVE 4 [Ziziphus jujuba]